MFFLRGYAACVAVGVIAGFAEVIAGLSAASVLFACALHQQPAGRWLWVSFGLALSLLFAPQYISWMSDHSAPAALMARSFGLVFVVTWLWERLPLVQWNASRVSLAVASCLLGVMVSAAPTIPLVGATAQLAGAGAVGVFTFLPGINWATPLTMDVWTEPQQWPWLAMFCGVVAAVSCFRMLRSWWRWDRPSAEAALMGLLASGIGQLWPWQWVNSYTLLAGGDSIARIATAVAPWQYLAAGGDLHLLWVMFGGATGWLFFRLCAPPTADILVHLEIRPPSNRNGSL